MNFKITAKYKAQPIIIMYINQKKVVTNECISKKSMCISTEMHGQRVQRWTL